MNEQKRQQVLVLGQLGWPLRRIEQATGVRRETASAYLKAAGIEVRRSGWRRRPPDPKPAIQAITDSGKAAESNPASMRRPAVSTIKFVSSFLRAALADSDCKQ